MWLISECGVLSPWLQVVLNLDDVEEERELEELEDGRCGGDEEEEESEDEERDVVSPPPHTQAPTTNTHTNHR